MSSKTISIYDTTLRDGAQSVGISFSVNDKLNIARALDRLKIDYIEGGWPGSNPKDDLFFKEIRKTALSHSKISAFGSTRRPNLSLEEDDLFNALIASKAEVITIVAKSWDFQVKKALNIKLEENLKLIYETISHLKDKGFTVFLDAEHLYDGFKSNQEYTINTVKQASEAGADMIVLCDTNGGTMPNEAHDITKSIINETKTPVGVHFHDDSGVAVANSISSVYAGAVSVQGTANGYGERCGNCNLMTFIPNLVHKMGYSCSSEDSMQHLTEISRFISETANLSHNESLPYVGDHAFAHKGGIHVSAIKKDTKTYEHISPSVIGNRRKVIVSELSGKSNIEFKAKELGIELKDKVSISKKILARVKELEDRGFQFEAAEGSFELIIREATGEYKPFFHLKGFRVITEMNEKQELYCEATITVEVDGKVEHTAANGNGPVDALDKALRKALTNFYPEISEMFLSDYKVRVIDEKSGTASAVRVLIDLKRKTDHWGTVGVSANIIEASWYALVDGIKYMLFKNELEMKTKKK